MHDAHDVGLVRGLRRTLDLPVVAQVTGPIQCIPLLETVEIQIGLVTLGCTAGSE
jgi:hypothetical protein